MLLVNHRKDSSVEDHWSQSQVRLNDSFWNILSFEVLLNKMLKATFLISTLTEHYVFDLLLNRSEPHDILAVQVPEEEPPGHREQISE